MNSGQLLVVHHGCDITLRDDLVSGRVTNLVHSSNKYDWLGSGAYFFENDFERALLFATNSHNNPSKRYTAKPIATPAVVCAVLCVSRWLDMTTQAGIHEYMSALGPMLEGLQESDAPIPTNHAASTDDSEILRRELDRAVFDFIHQVRKTRADRNQLPLPDFQAVRGAFQQGQKLSDGSGFHKNTHIQIALRDNSCVLGWFLPPGVELLSPAQYDEAKVRLGVQTRQGKPRVSGKDSRRL